MLNLMMGPSLVRVGLELVPSLFLTAWVLCQKRPPHLLMLTQQTAALLKVREKGFIRPISNLLLKINLLMFSFPYAEIGVDALEMEIEEFCFDGKAKILLMCL